MKAFWWISNNDSRRVEDSDKEPVADFYSTEDAEVAVKEHNAQFITKRELVETEPIADAKGDMWRTFQVAMGEPSKVATGESKSIFEGGATRSAMAGRYDLIPKDAIDAIARRLALGAEKHGENNWRSGGPEFRKATIAHLMKHLLSYMESGNQEDANTDAIICNAAFLCYFERIDPFKIPK